eukprot:8212154-Heterocapsa_arctica.AAC.1
MSRRSPSCDLPWDFGDQVRAVHVAARRLHRTCDCEHELWRERDGHRRADGRQRDGHDRGSRGTRAFYRLYSGGSQPPGLRPWGGLRAAYLPREMPGEAALSGCRWNTEGWPISGGE